MRKGISQIKIPIRPSELSIEKVEPYLESVFSQFTKNARKIRKYYDIYCLDHAIYGKKRSHDDTDVNNIVLIPDMKYMVDWKAGYTCGNPIKYAQSKTIDTDDIQYLNKHIRDCNKRTVDKNVVTWAYAVGKGFYFIEPKSESVNSDYEAPYVLYCQDADSCAKVYSSFGEHKPLFDILYTKVKEVVDGHEKTIEYYDLYFTDKLYTYKVEYGTKPIIINEQSRGISKPLPLTEKKFNSDCIGLVAMGYSMQNAVDKMISNGLDNIEDVVNEIFVYKNVNLGATPEEQKENHTAMKRNGAVVLNTPNGSSAQADLDTISPKLSLAEVKELYSIINERFHSTLGVPMATSATNSGGTTKSGSEVANGYDNAYNHALNDVNSFLEADQELLEKMLWICKNTKGNKIDKIEASEVEIKYSLNLTDNILTKTQSYVNLVQTGVPPTIALRICKLSNDPEAEGKLIEQYAEQKEQKVAEQQIAMAQQSAQNAQNDNNSQE